MKLASGFDGPRPSSNTAISFPLLAAAGAPDISSSLPAAEPETFILMGFGLIAAAFLFRILRR